MSALNASGKLSLGHRRERRKGDPTCSAGGWDQWRAGGGVTGLAISAATAVCLVDQELQHGEDNRCSSCRGDGPDDVDTDERQRGRRGGVPPSQRVAAAASAEQDGKAAVGSSNSMGPRGREEDREQEGKVRMIDAALPLSHLSPASANVAASLP